MNTKNKAVILLSGGLDSTTTLAFAKSKGFSCHCISFDYNQRQSLEIAAAQKIANDMGADSHNVFKLDMNIFGKSALTNKAINIPKYTNSDKIPITYVPARNIIFLSIALGYAETIGAKDIFIGVSSVDYSGYPDCRPEFIGAFQKAANLATKIGIETKSIQIHTPLIYLSKSETILLGHQLNVDYSKTITCYQISEDGEACGMCDACFLRKKGFQEAGIKDPAVYIR